MWCVKRRWVVSWLVEGAVSDHGVQGQAATAGQHPRHGQGQDRGQVVAHTAPVPGIGHVP